MFIFIQNKTNSIILNFSHDLKKQTDSVNFEKFLYLIKNFHKSIIHYSVKRMCIIWLKKHDLLFEIFYTRKYGIKVSNWEMILHM